MAQHENSEGLERAIADAVAGGVPREKAEAIVAATRRSQAAAPAAGAAASDPVRVWFDGAGWRLDPGALRSGLEMLGADDAQVRELLEEAEQRRIKGHLPRPFKGERWIVIPRWEEFQHPDAGRSAVPPWIKDYTRQLTGDEYLGLTFHQRGILHGLRLEYAAANRQLTDSTLTLTRRLGQRVATRDLEALNHAGFLQFSASKPASTPASKPASPEKRREETPISPSGSASTPDPPLFEPPTPAAGPHACPACGIQKRTRRLLDEHLVNVHGADP